LEGLAAAAFFQDDLEASLEARERAYALYRSADQPVDAARVAIALAWVYRAGRGERAVSDGWLRRARRLLDGRPAAPEHGWLALREASFALPGKVEFAVECCADAERLGRELGDVDLEMTALALGGLARVSHGEIAEGMARLDEASTAATAGEMQDPMAIGLSCCYLIFACERVRDLDRAGQWCQRVARMAEGWNVRALRAVCRAHYGTVLTLRGEWEEADNVLSEAAAALGGRPGEGLDAIARLAELRRRQGRTEAALELTAQAEHHPLAALVTAAIALERDDTEAAINAATRHLRMIEGARTERAAALEIVAEAQAVAGRLDEAAAAAQELRTIATYTGTDPLLGAASHAEGLIHASAGRAEAARVSLEEALERLTRSGLPFEAARTRVALARTLAVLGQEDAARRALTAARTAFADLGAAGEEQRTTALLAPARPVADARLTPRETEILRLVADGLSNRAIASRLTLSEHTVHRHVSNILVKLRVPSRAAAAALAAREGLTG
jgi:DNA-binding CsgD family transcriptional regulator